MDEAVIAQGPVDVEVRPAHGSDTFYNVVFGPEKYKGWKCVYAASGTLGFEHESGRQVCFRHPNILGGVRQCWDDFTLFANKPSNANSQRETKA